MARPGEAPRPLFLRFASEPNAPDDPYDLRREARLYRALADTRVPLPHLVGEHPAHAAVLLERVAGRSDFRVLAQPDGTLMARDFMHALHTLHALDAGSLGLGSPGSIGERVRGELLLHGERIGIDRLPMRDRSWGLRPEHRPKRTTYVTAVCDVAHGRRVEDAAQVLARAAGGGHE